MGQKARNRKVQQKTSSHGNQVGIKSRKDITYPEDTAPFKTSYMKYGLLFVISVSVIVLLYPEVRQVFDAVKGETRSSIVPEEASSKNVSSVDGDDTPQDRQAKELNFKTSQQESQHSEVPKEIRDFNVSYLTKVTAKKIFADGRRIPPVELLPQKPNNSSVKVYLFEEFLSQEECEGLMRVHNKHVQDTSKLDPILCFDSVRTLRKHLRDAGKKTKVTPRDFTEGTTCVNASFSSQFKIWLKSNWSYSTAFYPGESRFSHIFEHRVKEATGLDPRNGGKLQITSYPQGIGYRTHTDCVVETKDKRDRVATILVYLQDVEEGGETEFPELGIWVKPRKARALVWNNMNENGDCEPLSVHQAAAVRKGHKFILQRWYYYKNFYSLGKRAPDPPLPTRQPGQPRVTCDEYDHGSCRWYDEWNYEHIVDYERQKYTLI